MIIDSHQHLMLSADLQENKNFQAGIDKTVLFSSIPHPEKAVGIEGIRSEMSILNSVLSGENAQKKSKEVLQSNIQTLKDRLERSPEKYAAFAPVPLGMGLDETSEWIESTIKSGFFGLGEFTPGNEEYIKMLECIFRAAQQWSELPLWVHTFDPVTSNGIKILMKICKAYPKVPVIFGHLGGTNWIDVAEFAKENRQIYIDLSGAFSSLAVKTVITEVPERSLFSSDAPYGEPFLCRQMIEFLSPSKNVSQMVLGENIAELLHL